MDVATRAAVAFCKGTAELLADFHVAPPKERKGFLDTLGVTRARTIAETANRIEEAACSGTFSLLETKIKETMGCPSLDSRPVGVSWDAANKTYVAVANIQGSMLSTNFTTREAATAWFEGSKDLGSTGTKNMEAIQAKIKCNVGATEAMSAAEQPSQGKDVWHGGTRTPTKALKGEDVTASFLVSKYMPKPKELPRSQVVMYVGILQRLRTQGHSKVTHVARALRICTNIHYLHTYWYLYICFLV